jgi:hypothetical protein
MSKTRTTVRTPTVEFSRKGAPASEAGDVVRRKGVIFRAGAYPSQAYAMTPDELRALAADFSPVPVDLGHPSSSSPLDGQLGQLESVETSDDGTTLFGTVAFPRWLEDRLGDAKRLVSASFNRATKRLRALSLVTRPQIEDAELQAAFACACGHDEAKAETPAKETPPMTKKEQALARLAEMDDESVFDAILDDTPPDDDADEAPEAETSDFSMEEDPEKAELRARLEVLEDERRHERAANFAASEVAAHRLLPHEQDTAAAVMFQALSDDAIAGDAVDFSVGGKATRGTREAMVRAAYGQRRPHQWTEEKVANFGRGRALDNGGGGEETPEQRRARLDRRLANTAFGQSILDRRNANSRA